MRSLSRQFSRLQAGLGPPRSRRTVPPQRRPPEPAAEGRHRLPRQRHHREPRRQGAAARHSGSAHRGLSRTRAASLRWRGPFLSRFNRRRTMLTLVRRQPQQPRARFTPRSTPRFARRVPASPEQARGSPFADALTACALCFAQVHRPLRRLPRTAGRDAPGTRAGAPAEPARTSSGTASRSALRTAGHSIAVAAPIRRLHRR